MNTAMHALTKLAVLSQLLLTITGAIELTCETVNPLVQSNVTCVCKRTSGIGIDWYLNDVFHSNCLLSIMCLPQHNGFFYKTNQTENVFEITMDSYSYSVCTKVSCKDVADNTIERSIIPSSSIFDTTYPTSLKEPASNNEDGVISVTTSCISGFLDVEYQWYTIDGGQEEKYTPNQGTDFVTTNSSTCCNTGNNGKKTIGFIHEETYGSGTKNVSFKVVLSHASTNLQLNLTSNHVYSIRKVNAENIVTITVGWWKSRKLWEKILFIIGIAVIAIMIITMIVLILYSYRKKPGKVTITSSCESKYTTKIPVKWTVSGINVRNMDYMITYRKVMVQFGEPEKHFDDLINKWHHYNPGDVVGNTEEQRSNVKEIVITKNISTGSYYEITVVAINVNGEGVSDTKIIRTKIVTPSNTSSTQTMYKDKISVKWNIPEEENSNKLRFSIKYIPGSHTANAIFKHNIVGREFTLTDLSPDTSYTISVYAFINGNFGKQSNPIRVKTITEKNKKKKTDKKKKEQKSKGDSDETERETIREQNTGNTTHANGEDGKDVSIELSLTGNSKETNTGQTTGQKAGNTNHQKEKGHTAEEIELIPQGKSDENSKVPITGKKTGNTENPKETGNTDQSIEQKAKDVTKRGTITEQNTGNTTHANGKGGKDVSIEPNSTGDSKETNTGQTTGQKAGKTMHPNETGRTPGAIELILQGKSGENSKVPITGKKTGNTENPNETDNSYQIKGQTPKVMPPVEKIEKTNDSAKNTEPSHGPERE